MHQETVTGTCARCGENIDLVCPHLGRQVVSVRVLDTWTWDGELRYWSRCPSCKNSIFLAWYFADSKQQGFWDWVHKTLD